MNFSWWFFIGVWLIASLLKSPGLFVVLWPISIMLLFGWSALVVLLFPSPSVPAPILWWLYRAHQLQMYQADHRVKLKEIEKRVKYLDLARELKKTMKHERTDSWLCIYHLFVLSNFNFLHNSQWITLLTQSCIVLYSLYVPSLYPRPSPREGSDYMYSMYLCFLLLLFGWYFLHW